MGEVGEYYTVLAADGTRLPPFVLYKGVHYAGWTIGGPAGVVYRGVSSRCSLCKMDYRWPCRGSVWSEQQVFIMQDGL